MNEQTPPAVPQQNNKLSIISLVLGIFAIFPCSALAGIPAVITGHMALSRAGKNPGAYGGKGMAIAGLVMGYLSLSLMPVLILSGLLLPALSKAKGRAQEASCVSNLKQIALAARIYSNDNGDKFPRDFLTMSNELSTPKILVCNADTRHSKAQDWSTFSSSENVTYEFLVPGLEEGKLSPQTPLARCPIHGAVAYVDGSVARSSRMTQR